MPHVRAQPSVTWRKKGLCGLLEVRPRSDGGKMVGAAFHSEVCVCVISRRGRSSLYGHPLCLHPSKIPRWSHRSVVRIGDVYGAEGNTGMLLTGRSVISRGRPSFCQKNPAALDTDFVGAAVRNQDSWISALTSTEIRENQIATPAPQTKIVSIAAPRRRRMLGWRSARLLITGLRPLICSYRYSGADENWYRWRLPAINRKCQQCDKQCCHYESDSRSHTRQIRYTRQSIHYATTHIKSCSISLPTLTANRLQFKRAPRVCAASN
jgi:hypothetical protein